MPLLTDAELAGTRAAAEQVFDRTCSIGHRTMVQTDTGTEEQWPLDPALTDIGCGVREPRLGGEQLVASQVTVGASLTVLVAAGTPVRDTDHVFLDSGEVLNVVGVVAPVSYEVLRRVVCEVLR